MDIYLHVIKIQITRIKLMETLPEKEENTVKLGREGKANAEICRLWGVQEESVRQMDLCPAAKMFVQLCFETMNTIVNCSHISLEHSID